MAVMGIHRRIVILILLFVTLHVEARKGAKGPKGDPADGVVGPPGPKGEIGDFGLRGDFRFLNCDCCLLQAVPKRGIIPTVFLQLKFLNF